MAVSRPAAVVVLAAGAGTRMKSQVPKVLHPICGVTMLDHALAAARELDPAELIVVVGHQRREVIDWLDMMKDRRDAEITRSIYGDPGACV